MVKWWAIPIALVVGAVLAVAVVLYATKDSGAKLNAAIDGYRATESADYADRLSYIARFVAAGGSARAISDGLRTEVNYLRSQLVAGAVAEAERQRQQDERDSKLAGDIGDVVKSSHTTVQLAVGLRDAIRKFLGIGN